MLSARRPDRAPLSPGPKLFRSAWRLLALGIVPIMAAGLIVTPVPAAAAADIKADLGVSLQPWEEGGDVAAGQDKIFVSAKDRIVVADTQAAVTDTISNLPGLRELALTADGAHLYAAVAGSNQVAEIDTETLAITRRIDMTAYPCPSSLSLSGSRLYVGYGCSTNMSGVVSLDVSAAEPEYTQILAGLYKAPLLAAAAMTLVVGDTGLSPSSLLIYDVSGAVPTRRGVISGSTYNLSNLLDLAITPDGATVFSAFGSPYRFDSWDTTTVTHVRSYGQQAYSQAVALSPDGALLVGGRSRGIPVEVFDVATGESRFTHENRDDEVIPGSIAILGTTVFALRRDPSYRLSLWRLPDVALPASSLTLTAPYTATVLDPITLTGRLTLSDGSAPGAQPLKVTRHGYDGTAESLPMTTTAEDGTFTVTDIPQAIGRFTYDVAWDGNSAFRWSRAWWWAGTLVEKRMPSLTLSRPSTPQTALEPLTMTGRLTLVPGSAPGAQRLTVTRRLPGDDTEKPLPEVTTDDDGTFTVTDTPPVGGTVTYEVSWAGDAIYDPNSDSRVLRVAKRRTTLTVSGPEETVAGSQIEFSGELDGDGRLPSPNAVLMVRRTLVGSTGTTTTPLSNVTVSDDGSFRFTDTPGEAGEYTYSVKWAGDDTFSAVEGARVVTVGGPTE
ncbi:WD40 repeat domain-containing protein [Microbispora rosea]